MSQTLSPSFGSLLWSGARGAGVEDLARQRLSLSKGDAAEPELNVLREHLDQEGADRISRRVGRVRDRVQLPRLAQLGVDLSGRFRDRDRIPMGADRSGSATRIWSTARSGASNCASGLAGQPSKNMSSCTTRAMSGTVTTGGPTPRVQVWEDSRLVYPTELMATHGFTSVEPWPIDRQGRDLSVIRNQIDGPVSLFTYKTREPFVGVYHPHTNSGTVTVADPAELPVHKVWSWGNDREAATWRTALSDDDSGYVELQAGLFRNQETYAFLEPQESVHFSEYWLPVRDLGGITRANVDAVLHMERPAASRVTLALDVTRDFPDARLSVRQGSQARARPNRQLVAARRLARDTRERHRRARHVRATGRNRADGAGPHGEHVRSHTRVEGATWPANRSRERHDPTEMSADDVVEDGLVDELEGRRLAAMSTYRAGLERYPHSLALLKAAGRLAVALTWPDAGTDASSRAIGWLEEAHALNTTDFETRYYLGLALLGAGRSRDARPHLEAAQRFRATRDRRHPAARAPLRPRRTDGSGASAGGDAWRGVSLVRRSERRSKSRCFGVRAGTSRRAIALDSWQTIDPTSSLLRYERTLAGDPDPDLWQHLGADANRVLDLVDQYLAIGDYTDALGLLDRKYPAVDAPAREVGAVSPQESPLIALLSRLRASARRRKHERGLRARDDVADDLRLSEPAIVVSPCSTAALEANPSDATARFLLGSLYMANGLLEPAIAEWQRTRHDPPAIPTLDRNLGLALLQAGNHDRDARAVLEEGVVADSRNVDVYLALDGVLSAANASPRDRVAALRRFPSPERMPVVHGVQAWAGDGRGRRRRASGSALSQSLLSAGRRRHQRQDGVRAGAA